MTARDRQSVAATYDRIAEHFSKTRQSPWPEVTAFLDGRTGRVGLDVGCGNGRHLSSLARRTDRAVGVDLSERMLAVAAGRLAGDADGTDRADSAGVDLVVGDAATLPVADRAVDLAVYVATLHHLPDRRTRIASLDDLARVLVPGGRALVGVWSTTHDRFDRETGFDTAVDWTLPGGETVPRFYHVYDPAEFRGDLRASALEVVETELSSGNCYATVGPGEG